MVTTEEIAKELMKAITPQIHDLQVQISELNARNKIVEHRILIIANDLEKLNEKEINKRLNTLEGKIQTLSSVLMNQQKHRKG